MIQSRVICQDTYMEIKCATYGSGEFIAVLDAQLTMEVDPNICPNIVGKHMLLKSNISKDATFQIYS